MTHSTAYPEVLDLLLNSRFGEASLSEGVNGRLMDNGDHWICEITSEGHWWGGSGDTGDLALDRCMAACTRTYAKGLYQMQHSSKLEDMKTSNGFYWGDYYESGTNLCFTLDISEVSTDKWEGLIAGDNRTYKAVGRCWGEVFDRLIECTA